MLPYSGGHVRDWNPRWRTTPTGLTTASRPITDSQRIMRDLPCRHHRRPARTRTGPFPAPAIGSGWSGGFRDTPSQASRPGGRPHDPSAAETPRSTARRQRWAYVLPSLERATSPARAATAHPRRSAFGTRYVVPELGGWAVIKDGRFSLSCPRFVLCRRLHSRFRGCVSSLNHTP